MKFGKIVNSAQKLTTAWPTRMWAMLVSMLLLPALVALGETPHREPFAWNQDQLWTHLEQRFAQARTQSCGQLNGSVRSQLNTLASLVRHAKAQVLSPGDPVWDRAEAHMLSVAPLLAACPDEFQQYLDIVQQLEVAAKSQAEAWPADSVEVRQRLYRLIYGGRSAIEEIMLQMPPSIQSGILLNAEVPSATPSIKVKGVTLHSGDILVSRGGAATSALIARGNDFPGNFSHVALLYVDAATHEPSVVEALIETGTVITPLDHYLKDKKLRIMVLRMRSDLPAMQNNPLLAHEAAQWAYQKACRQHIAYDFEMDYQDHTRLFCAEVVYAAYEHMGVRLWTGLSHISAEGAMRWLAAFGVSHFVTLEPSDLEYDPQLTVVSEWRDPDTLLKDHVDNAVTDVMLEKANEGDAMKYNRFLLPVAGALKVYSVAKNRLGAVGPIPEGMGTAAALRNRWYTKQHRLRVSDLMVRVDDFKKKNGYTPPYWELVRLARKP